MKKFLLLSFLFAIFSLLSCDKNEDLPIDDSIGQNTGKPSAKEIEFERVQDSILKNYSSAIRLINQIDTELSKLSNTPGSPESVNYEQDILKKIDYLSFQLKSANDDINKLEIKLKSLGKENKSLQEKIQTLESILAEKDKIIENQKDRIGSLENELQVTKSERDLAYVEKANIEKFASETEIKKNTAYYVVGNEKTLEQENIIKMEGEGFLGIGGKYIPSPEAELRYFTRIDITKDTLIPIPNNSKVAEIVSSHSKRLLELQNSPSGSDYLRIRTPETFWRTDRLLIIIIEEK
jgi:hypothetical protein